MKLYVAGKMRGLECFGFPAFAEATERLRAAGHEVISPAEMDQEKYGWGSCPEANTMAGFTIEDALRRDYEAVVSVDGIALLPGWETSTGARFEKTVAEALGRAVFYYEPYLATFILHAEDPVEAPSNLTEVRVTSATGGQKGQKQAQLGAIDPLALTQLALVAGMGSAKYARFNYVKGYDWSLSIDALYRHFLAFQNGEDTDEESGLPHTAHIAWHGLALTTFLLRNLGTDDRIGGSLA